MDLLDRPFKLHNILKQAQHPVSFAFLQEQLECSRATVHRLIRDLRSILQAPIEYDRTAGGYYYAGDDGYELPGLWFNASELQALLAAEQLLSQVQPGLLESHLDPVRERIRAILRLKHLGGAQVSRRVRILGMAVRGPDPEHFRILAHAVIQRKRLRITYHSRSYDTVTERFLSPQRLVHYRDNWYLDAWDHRKRKLRSFAVERVQKATVLKQPAQNIAEKILDEHFASSYGIFAGKPKFTARLRFTPERSRWVAEEIWHPRQKETFENGHYVLEIPCSDPRELVMDILKHGPHVEVLAPEPLRQEVARQLAQALRKYSAGA